MAHLPLWYLGQIPSEICDKAVEDFLRIPPRDATMGANGEEVSHAHRDTTVRFAQKDHWFGDTLREFGAHANKECGWGYELNDYEAVQYARYGVGQHYNWHVDNFPLAGLPTDRKVSVVCLLCEPSDFGGGELQVRLYSEYTALLTKGALIAFPSILEHRVTPVTAGLRATATMWLSGPRFK